MTRQIVNDFPVDTNGHCFICLNKVVRQNCLDKLGTKLSAPAPFASVHALSQYLKMDMSKVFHEKESIPSELLESVKRSKLKVTLCAQCTKWNKRMAALCRQLEKIETEVSFYLDLIHENFARSDEDSNNVFYNLEDTIKSNGELLEKVRIAKSLRMEGMQKCSIKLLNVQPRVKVQNMTVSQVTLIRRRANSKYRQQKSLTLEDEKLSKSAINISDAEQNKNEDDDRDGNDYFDVAAASLDSTISEDEDDSINSPTGENYYQNRTANTMVDVKPETVTGENHRTIRTNRWKVRTLSANTKVLPSSSNPVNTRKKLTYVVDRETGKFKCNICSVGFKRKGNLKQHYDGVHLKIKHKCNLCGKEFSSKSHYNRHHGIAHVGVRFKCNICESLYTTKQNLSDHQESAHLGKRFQCELCTTSYMDRRNLARHLRLSHPQ